MIEIPTDLPADLVPLSWLIGVWEGTGVIDYEADGRTFSGEFAHRVSFSHDGGDFLNYSAHAWLLDGEERRPLVAETGYWRVARPATDADPGPALLPPTDTAPRRTADDVEALRTAEGGFPLEVSLAHSDGILELYLGQVRGPRIDLASDAVVRTAGAKPYASATRLYGLVDDHLLWAWDVSAFGRELASHASARLARAE
ncbi:MAG: FABP family protein [Microbacterium sp. 71-36]|uniref:FABP family protein n=1 Tax=unclassified Microbacterium TaxID=2609290 RepID=UPI00086CE8B0|nr:MULTISPECIES: FABP family protein [unclassified Microbacterium]MBN9212504.1 FABP family protein [Microbacterium sp.]ODT41079.1 MAG: fatty acid-binding protein [Microbacterium sp. SCN 71-17]OJV77621.1 MAG: FABP family protein [Microbacterium sp. 71-36]SIS10307.1 protein of unknown function [Microbacterium sp. RURRCA19A]